MDDGPEALRAALDACADGRLPPNVTLLRLATAARDAAEAEGALVAAARARPGPLDGALALWRANQQAFGTVKAVLRGTEHDRAQGVADWAAIFDRLAAEAPDAGVALYGLGNPGLLAAATDELVARLAGWGLAGPTVRVLDLGCGSGRVAAALAPRVAHLTGLDLSLAMVERARERCAGLPNVAFAATSGRDLAGQADGAFDLVLAADVFPYLVQSDGDLATRHVLDAARVLRPGGHLAILNFSYRGDPAADRAEVAALAASAGLDVARMASGDFALWDAETFLLRRP